MLELLIIGADGYDNESFAPQFWNIPGTADSDIIYNLEKEKNLWSTKTNMQQTVRETLE